MPARKRRARRTRKRTSFRRWYFVVVLLAVLSLLVVTQISRRTSRPFKPKPKRNLDYDPARITARYGAILRREGGDGVWVKQGAQPGLEHHPPLIGEVLALAPASATLVSGLEREAASDGLRLDISSRQDGSSKTRILMLFGGSKAICGWRLREVERICRAAIIIDDLGQSLKIVQEALNLHPSITLSVLPYLPASRQTATEAHQAGREVMLHLPMEALRDAEGSENAVREGMAASEVERVIAADLDSVPFTSGVNNHMGSRATTDALLMSEVMKVLAQRHLYFIDSRTTATSVALKVAREAGLPAFYRSVFLDDTESIDYTLGELQRLRAIVRQQGVALAIGHPHPTTLTALKRFLPELDRDDIELVPASRIVRLVEAASLSPPRGPAIAGGD